MAKRGNNKKGIRGPGRPGQHGGSQKVGLTPIKVMAGTALMGGAASVDVAKTFGVSKATVNKWRNEYNEYLMNSPEFQNHSVRILGLIDKAIDIYKMYLTGNTSWASGAPDLSAARDVLKYVGHFIDRTEVHHTHEKTFVAMTDEELLAESNKLQEAIRAKRGSDTPEAE